MRPLGGKEYVVSDHLGSTRAVISDMGAILERKDYKPFGEVLATAGTGARTGYINREEDGESGLGSYGVRLYESEYGRFTSADVLWEKYMGRTGFHYALNSPINLIDKTGLDSSQRAQMVEFATSYLESGSTYLLGAKGLPGKPVDCSGLVNNAMISAGEESTLTRKGATGTGVQRIEQAGEEISFEDAEPGNVVTFRTGGSWGFHTGIITDVIKDEKGKTASIKFVHSSSTKNGPGVDWITSANGSKWFKRLHGIYKVDSKPESVEQETQKTGDGINTPRQKELDRD